MKKTGRVAAAVLSVGLLYYAGKAMVHNVMSHAGFREGVVSLDDPKIFFTKGHYQGFQNAVLLGGADESIGINKMTYEPDPFDKLEGPLHDLDLVAVYLGRKENPLPPSKYKPTSLTGAEDIEFYSIKDYFWRADRMVGEGLKLSDEDLGKILRLEEGGVLAWDEVVDPRWHLNWPVTRCFTNVDLGNYTLSFGRDEKGIYTSIYDVFDFSPNSGFFSDSGRTLPERMGGIILPLIGTPIHFYDRIYWDDHGVDTKALLAQVEVGK